MEIFSIFKAILTPDRDQTAQSFAFLKPGDKVLGTVLRLEPDGRALIDLGRVRAMAHNTIPVQVGQQLPLKVVQGGIPVHLRLDEVSLAKPQLPSPQAALAALLPEQDRQLATRIIDKLLSATPQAPGPGKTGLGAGQGTTPTRPDALTALAEAAPQTLSKAGLSEPVRHALMQLKAMFEPLALEAPTAQQSQWVQSAVEDSGPLFEMKLAQLVDKSGSTAPLAQTPSTATMTGIEDRLTAKTATNSEPELKPEPSAQNSKTTLNPGMGNSQASRSPGPFISPEEHTASGAPRLTSDNPMGPQTTPEGRLRLDQDPALDLLPEDLRMKALAADLASPKTIEHPADQKAVPSAQPLADSTHESAVRILTRDLKPQLLILKSFFSTLMEQSAEIPDAKTKEVAFLRQAVDQILGHVEEQQQQAVRRAGEPELYQVFSHLLPVKDHAMPVKLKVYYPKKGGPAKDDPRHRIALLLDMDHLGLVRADLSMIDRSLRIHFYVRDESVQSLFAQQSQTVSQALEPVFDQVLVETQVSKEKIERFEEEDLQGPPVGRIDVKA